jgi:hypothetical protein
MNDVDWSRMFKSGMCPSDVVGKLDLEAPKLTGEWYMHRSSEFLMGMTTPTCHHASMKIGDDGSFVAFEEATFLGKTFVAENIKGQFTKNVVRADFFDDKVSVKVQVLDTDYDNFMIGYECWDNMKFALENEIEPVHIIKLAILTHKSDEDQAFISSIEDKVVEKLPWWKKEDFAIIKQGTEANCKYQTFDLSTVELPKKEGIVSKTTTEAKELVKGAGEKVSKVGDRIKRSIGN